MPRLHYKNYKFITLLARDLRKNQTPSEKLVWELLRRQQLSGYKFLRQHPIVYRIEGKWVDFYIADFYCAELNLIIEPDGPIHKDRKEYDSERDSKLLNKGIRVVRIRNEEGNINLIMTKLIGILEKVNSNSKIISHISTPL